MYRDIIKKAKKNCVLSLIYFIVFIEFFIDYNYSKCNENVNIYLAKTKSENYKRIMKLIKKYPMFDKIKKYL